jgi:excisionase family DNA binding protein
MPSDIEDTLYTVKEVAKLMSVSRNTVAMWVKLDVFEPGECYRMPVSGQIRIRESAIVRLQSNPL